MATVTLSQCYLLLVSSPATSLITFPSTGRTDDRVTPGQIRRYANGRLRVVTTSGDATTLAVTARQLTAAQLAQLDSYRGQLALFRDAWGRKMYGTFFALKVTDYKDTHVYDAAFTFQQVSYSEAV